MLALGPLVPALGQSSPDSARSAPAFRIYTSEDQPATLADVAAAMGEVDVVFLGEQHADPVAHRLHAELLGRAYAEYGTARPVVLSLEMFERDVQAVVDEYVAGLISARHFKKSARAPGNYEQAYAPLVEFAKAQGLAVLAANAPRRYVNRVSRRGPASLDSLSAWARQWLPPLPYPAATPAYAAKWDAAMGHVPAHGTPDSSASASPSPHATSADEEDPAEERPRGRYLLDAQALWDAAMAHALARHLTEQPGALVLHVTGSFHVEGGLGTPAQLEYYRPGTRRLLVVVKPVADVEAFDAEAMGGLGDFIILSDKAAR